MSDGYLVDEGDMRDYVNYCTGLLSEKAAKRWVDEERWQFYEENKEFVERDLSSILNFYAREERLPTRDFTAKPIKKMREMAEKGNDERLAWWAWRTDNSPLIDTKGKPLGYGGELLIESLLLNSFSVIKHTYRKKPEPVELRLTEAKQADKSIYIGSAPSAELDAICKVPWMDPTMDSHEFGRRLSSDVLNENEWQRVVNQDRVMTIASFIHDPGNYIFNPVLLYINKNSNCFHEIKKLDGDGVIEVSFDFLQRTKKGWVDFFFNKGSSGDLRPAIIIDGQHRIRGMVSDERGKNLNIPFVMIIGDGSKEDQRLIAEIFTQINTKNEPLGTLHKMYLSYKFGIIGNKKEDDWSVSDWEVVPAIPTETARPQRRAYELALYMSSEADSPLYDMIQFLDADKKRKAKAHICVKINNWVTFVRKWFVSNEKGRVRIYSDSETDSYFKKEFLNFFSAFEETCKVEWEDPRWRVGAGGANKPFLQKQGPFLSLLDFYPKLVDYIRSEEAIDEFSINQPIGYEIFLEYLRPLTVVDWRSPSLNSSNLTGRNNNKTEYLVDWMFRSIERGEVYTKTEVLDVNEESVIGKGLIAPPGRSEIEKIGGPDWPGVLPIQVRCKHLAMTQGSGWILRISTPSRSIEVETKNYTEKIKNGNFGETQLTIESEIIPKGATDIEIQAFLENVNGKTYTEKMTLKKG